MARLPLIKGLIADENAEWRDAIPVNMTGFAQEVAGSSGYLRTIDGLTQFSLPSAGGDRGAYWSEKYGYHARVIGNKLFNVGQFGDLTQLSSSIAGSDKAKFNDGATTGVMLAGGDVWLIEPTGVFQKQTNTGYIDQTWVSDYFFWTDGTVIRNSTVGSPNLDPTGSYAGSNFSPDPIVGLDKTTSGKLIVFNRYTTELFVNQGNPVGEFPFSRINGSIPLGIVGTDAKVNLGDGSFMVFGGPKERSPSFYIMGESGQYQNVSTKEIDSIIDDYSDYELVTMNIEFRDTRDQSLVICHLPRNVLVYDLTLSRKLGSNIWYEWKSGNGVWRGVNGIYDPRNVDSGASGWVYGDKVDGRLGKLDKTTCTQYGDDLQWSCTTPLIKVGGRVNLMEVLTPAGHNTQPNPRLFMSTTKDGSLYGPEVLISQGGQGEYGKRILYRRLGDYPNLFGLRLRGYSDVTTTLSGCEVL